MGSNEVMNLAAEADSGKKYTRKIQWDRAEHYAFLKHVAHAVRKGHKKGPTLDKQGWDLVIALLKREDNIIADKNMLKNHYDKSRRLCRGWTELKGYTGLGWNPIMHTFIVPQPVWDNFFKRHKDCKRYKLWGYDEAAEANLYTIFDKNEAMEQNRMYDSSDSVPPNETHEEQPDRAIECCEDMDVNSPTLDNDFDSENREEVAQPTTKRKVFGSTSQARPSSISNTAKSLCFHRPGTSPRTSKRATRKRKSQEEVTSAGHEIAHGMKERKAVAHEAIHSASIEDLEEEKFNKCVALLKALPGYNLADPMYTAAATYFLKKPLRRLWLGMGDDVEYRETWLRGYWLEHRGV